MKKWATSLVLILVMAGGLLGGVPIHFGGHGCSDMECCMTDMESAPSHHGETPTEQAANLYCFLSCPEPLAPARTGAEGKVSPTVRADKHPVAAQSPIVIPIMVSRRYQDEVQQQDSHPIYIRHLALLI